MVNALDGNAVLASGAKARAYFQNGLGFKCATLVFPGPSGCQPRSSIGPSPD
jgi:hypothetical protein